MGMTVREMTQDRGMAELRPSFCRYTRSIDSTGLVVTIAVSVGPDVPCAPCDRLSHLSRRHG